MSVFKKEKEFKRVIFNVDAELAERLERAKEASRQYGKKLDVDSAIDKALEKFLKKAEKKLEEMQLEADKRQGRAERGEANAALGPDASGLIVSAVPAETIPESGAVVPFSGN